MPIRKTPPAAPRPFRLEQLDLFLPVPQRPHWTSFPPTARQQVIELVTQLIVEAVSSEDQQEWINV